MIDLNAIWFTLFGFLIIGYAILDGFDLGVGILHIFAKKEEYKIAGLNSIAPVWDGNEVWLLTGGGALFAAFPPVYATVFSGFYLALILVLAALIFRAVSIEFRNKMESPLMRKFFDYSFGFGSLLATLLFGVAVGNIIRGVPINANFMWAGSFFGLLNPYSLFVGILTVMLFTLHGSIYLAMKSDGELQNRMHNLIPKLWLALILLYIIATIMTIFSSGYLFAQGFSRPLYYFFLLMVTGGLAFTRVWASAAKYGKAFLASAITIVSMIALPATTMFPTLVPSSINPEFSLTAYNASSSQYTLTVMLIIALIGMPFVLWYTIWLYRTFRGKITEGY